MKIVSLLAIFLLASQAKLQSGIATDENGVIILTSKSFDDSIGYFDYLMVEFYSPRCPHCQHFAPAYGEAAEILAKADPPFRLAKLDCTDRSTYDIQRHYGIQGYPTVLLFKNDGTYI
eukprot:CAMPEP_0170556634 /NCGR_PEP_ID=MMETSP0211-20121228/17862_1 /TAXON_ID=311385 /ORGANISM="Pseudokeronopsis sp., Strain OXSARD2" /LENGTH=117 /DNA_ID=CAMNT_0010867093 /DNA_START=3 /DNA_END=356 /DNA_ORIENTATION=+